MRFLIIAALLLVSIPGQAASSKDLEGEVAELRRINEAQANNLATAMNQLQEVLSNFQKLSGQVDQSQYLNDQQAKVIQDSQRRLEILEDRSQQLVTQLEEIKSAGFLKEVQAKKLSEFKSYQIGLAKLNAEQFKEAAQTLKAFVTANPKSAYAANAQYWIGESYYAMRDFPAAITEFQKVVKSFPKSEKTAASLLKQGFSFFEMQALDESKAFLTKLIAQFPGTNEAVRASDRIREIERIIELKAKQAVEKRVSS